MANPATTPVKKATLIDRINTAFPAANAVDASEFYGRDSHGIWFRQEGECAPDGLPLYDSYRTPGEEVHPELDGLLESCGWFWEPYDAGTLMAFPG